MAQASLQLNQITGDGALLNALKKGISGKKNDAPTPETNPARSFQNLLAGMAKVKNSDQVSAILTASAGTSKADAGLEQLHLTPELAAFLKTLTAQDIKNLPPEIAGILQTHMGPDGMLDAKTISILDALSAPATDETPELFTIVDDPYLAAFLAGLAAKTAGMQNNTAVSTSTLPQTGDTRLTTDASVHAAAQPQALTFNLADMDGEEFQAFKKLAFADIAPFLTAPRNVRIDGSSVMKMAQGPAFLNDEGTDNTLMSIIAGLIPALPATGTALLGENNTNMPATGQSGTPMFLDANVLAQNAAKASPLPQAFGKSNLFAALLGAANPDTQGEAGQAGPSATANQTAAKDGVVSQAPVAQVAAQAASGVGNAAAQTIAHISIPAASVAMANGLNNVAKGLDNGLAAAGLETEGTGLLHGFDSALNIRADQNTPASASNTLMTARSANHPHPSTHLVSVTLQRNGEAAFAGEVRQFTIQLDPEKLGRVKITLEFGANNTVKAKLLAERPETVALMQKDAAMLERALQDSGVDTGNSTLTFDLGQEGSFSGGSGHQYSGGESGGNAGSGQDGTELANIETVMPVFVDPETGMTHVNIVI